MIRQVSLIRRCDDEKPSFTGFMVFLFLCFLVPEAARAGAVFSPDEAKRVLAEAQEPAAEILHGYVSRKIQSEPTAWGFSEGVKPENVSLGEGTIYWRVTSSTTATTVPQEFPEILYIAYPVLADGAPVTRLDLVRKNGKWQLFRFGGPGEPLSLMRSRLDKAGYSYPCMMVYGNDELVLIERGGKPCYIPLAEFESERRDRQISYLTASQLDDCIEAMEKMYSPGDRGGSLPYDRVVMAQLENDPFPWLVVGAVAGVVILAGAALLLLSRKKRKRDL